uniref:RNA helicase n=1 Tax=Meloidogyne incognita TaxID=6306 RepID=A0A914MPZ6_MELIC
MEEDKKLKHFEQIRQIRKKHRIFTWGTNIPDPIENFSDFHLPDKLSENLKEFSVPTPVQMQGIPIGLQHRDLLVTAPTGASSGKTLAFALPIILRILEQKQQNNSKNSNKVLSAIILEPTKILAIQTFQNFVKFCFGLDINCCYLNSKIATKIEKNLEKCAINILVCTPNRLIYLLEKLENEKKSLNFLSNLEWLIVDECDRIFEGTEGENCFKLQLDKILNFCCGPNVRHGFFSATFSCQVENWCREKLKEMLMVCIGPRNSANELVKQELLFAGWEQAKVQIIRDILRKNFEPPALIFLQSKDRAKQLFAELMSFFEGKIFVGLISGDLSEKECQLVVERFRSGSIDLLICTELMGRGIDFQNVNLVINFDLPTSIISYIHRIGRTGRAGRVGRAITLFTESDMPIIRPISTVIHQAGFPVPEYLLKLHKPTREEKKNLKKRAPKRKNLTIRWGGLKNKFRPIQKFRKNIKIEKEENLENNKSKKLKIEEKLIENKIPQKINEKKKRKEKIKREKEIENNLKNTDDGEWQLVTPKRRKREFKKIVT